MPERASYRKLDFVDYFKALTQTQDKWIEEFVSDQKRLAILQAFVTNRVTLGRALDFLICEFPKLRLAGVMERCLRQSARRYFLAKEDPRHINVGDDVRKGYVELLSSTEGAKDDFWFSPDSGASVSFSKGEDRPLLAKIDAFNRRLDDMEPHDHVADIAHFAGSDLPSLHTSLRSLVMAHLSRDIRSGIVEIPTDLQADFPEIYAERGVL